jgi:DNA-binding MarR family transcriptional regulator
MTEQSVTSSTQTKRVAIEADPQGYTIYMLSRAHHAVRRAGAVRLRKWNLTMASYMAMRILAESPGLSSVQVARRSFVQPQTMNRLIGQLEGRGLLVRRSHPESGRSVSVWLTEKGEELLRDCYPEVTKVNQALASVLGAGEAAFLDEVLRKCAYRLEEDLEQLTKEQT